MKFLHTSDWHIGKFLNEYNLIEDQQYFLSKLIKYISEIKFDLILISGDVYHRSVPSIEAVNLVNNIFFEIIDNLKIPILIISGNHDSRDRLGFGNGLFKNSGLYIETKIKEEISKISLNDEFGKINFYTIPYTEPNFIRNLLKNEKITTFNNAFQALVEMIKKDININERNILMAHGYFRNLKNTNNKDVLLSESEISVGGSDLIDASILDIFDYVALGHLHSPQNILDNKIRYSGSILKYSLSEIYQKKSVTSVEIKEKNNIEVNEIFIKPKRDLKNVIGSFEEITDIDNFENVKSDDYIFVTLNNQENIIDPVLKLRTIFPNIIGVEFKSNDKKEFIESASLKIKSKSIEDLFDSFYGSITGSCLSGEQKDIVLEISNKLKDQVI